MANSRLAQIRVSPQQVGLRQGPQKGEGGKDPMPVWSAISPSENFQSVRVVAWWRGGSALPGQTRNGTMKRSTPHPVVQPGRVQASATGCGKCPSRQ
jgi:hypothetical protein